MFSLLKLGVADTRFSSLLCYIRANPAVPTAIVVLKLGLFTPGRSWTEENTNKSRAEVLVSHSAGQYYPNYLRSKKIE